MKKLVTLSIALVAAGSLNAQGTWSLGISASSIGNCSYYSGGMTGAEARFHHNTYNTGSLGFVARKTFNPHWSFQTGLGFSSVGFNFTLAQNYSLLNKNGQYINSSVSTGTAVIPASIIYNTNLNCRNWRWFWGGGISAVMSGKTSSSSTGSSTDKDNVTVSLQQNYSSPSFFVLNGHLLGGIEKVYKKGGIFSLGFIFNAGTKTLATTNVSYSFDGKTYNHTFTNRGNYFGIYAAYHFRPLAGKHK